MKTGTISYAPGPGRVTFDLVIYACNPLRPTPGPPNPELDLARVLGITAFELLFFMVLTNGV